MTYKQAIDYYGGPAELASALGVARSTVYMWGDSDAVSAKKIPWQWQCAIAFLTHDRGIVGRLYPTKGPWQK